MRESTPPTGRRTAPGAASGITIIELLVVLALIAALMGIGVSMFMNLGKQGVFTATVSRVLSTLNSVRNSSMSYPAALQVSAGDAEKGELNGVGGVQFVPMWQSQCEMPPADGDESTLLGALDRNGTLPAGAVFRDGVIGRALFLEGGGAVDCGNYSVYDATEGIAVDLWVFPTSVAGGTLVRRGESLTLALTRQSEGLGIRLDLGFASLSGVPGESISSAIREGRNFEPKGVLLPVNRWSRVVATYDRNHVTILVDTGRGAVEKLRAAEKAPLSPQVDANLYIGGGGGAGRTFKGGIDDVRLDGVLVSDFQPFPAGVSVDGPTRRIRFVNDKLDPAYHTGPESLVLRYGQRKREIVIGLEGNVVSK
jgi:hypothetical protein